MNFSANARLLSNFSAYLTNGTGLMALRKSELILTESHSESLRNFHLILKNHELHKNNRLIYNGLTYLFRKCEEKH